LQPNFVAELNKHGYAIAPNAVDSSIVDALISALDQTNSDSVRKKDNAAYAIRNLLTLVPEVRALADSSAIRALVEPILGASAFPIRGLLFDKTPEANWKVFWHQDLTVPVQKQIETPGFRNWNVKSGVQHVEAPASILESLLAVRLHLDDCDADNGPLHVLPRTHLLGHLNGEAIDACKAFGQSVECHVARGGVMLMRPLLLHASFPAKNAAHRRVIHLQFAAAPLPGELEWQVS
jgi:ectoine hydroxylase-related dioxygenase (phytanoyl-CoA dioxygenase family)